MHGIKIFRPDLVIDSEIYSEYCIDPETFEFQRAKFNKDMRMIFSFMIVVFVAAVVYANYRSHG